MNILYVCTFYHRAMVFRDSMNNLEKREHKVLAFNAVAKGSKIDKKYEAIMDDKVVHKECFENYDRFFFHIKQNKIRKSIEKNVEIKEFDLIHSHTLFNGGWATYKIHKKTGIPYVVSVRNTDLNVFMRIPVYKKIAKTIVNNSSGVLFLSEAYRKKFLNMCYPHKGREQVDRKCDVIPNGLESFWLQHISDEKKTIHTPLELLCVGKIDKNKNMTTTLQAMESLHLKGIETHLTVIGQVLDDNVKALLDENKNVTVIPYMTKEELIDYYRKSDIFVMPSFNETFGRVYAEAMTQGVPVIYTRGQGFDGIFPEGLVGYSVDAHNAEEIATVIRKITDNYAAISENCRRECSIFDWVRITERLENLYNKAITGG